MIKDEFYSNRVITEVLFSHITHMVSIFKEHLIYDDACEFLQRFVDLKETKRLI
jgi:hypothetical protein